MKQLAGLYNFREITEEEDLLAAFRMRYYTYSNQPSLRNLVKENSTALDIDGFDAYARHYGIFKTATKEQPETMIGYMRVIWQSEQPVVDAVLKNIGQRLKITIPEKPPHLYIQKNFVSPGEIQKLPIDNNRISICEPGRFILLPAYRSAGLAQFAVESVMTVICALSALPVGVMDCRRHHRPWYERNGFSWVTEQENPDIPSNPWNLMMISRADVAQNLQDLEERISRYQQDGCLYHRLGYVDWLALAFLPMMLRRWGRTLKFGLVAIVRRIGHLLQSLNTNPVYQY
jgi:hypothetical protein